MGGEMDLWNDRATAATVGSVVALIGLLVCGALRASAGVAFFAVVGGGFVLGSLYCEARLARAKRGHRSR